jgi:hypothetical protein
MYQASIGDCRDQLKPELSTKKVPALVDAHRLADPGPEVEAALAPSIGTRWRVRRCVR